MRWALDHALAHWLPNRSASSVWVSAAACRASTNCSQSSLLVDTDWVIDAFAGFRAIHHALNELRDADIGISIVSYGEIFEGAFDNPSSDAQLALYRRNLAMFQLFPLTVDIMENFVRRRIVYDSQDNAFLSLLP